MGWNNFFSKKIEIRYTILLGLIFLLGLSIYGGILKSYLLYKGAYGKLGKATEKIADFPSLVKQSFTTVKKGFNPLIIPNQFPYLNGFKFTDSTVSEDGFMLNTHFVTNPDQSVVDLMDLNNQQIIHRWILPLQFISKTYNVNTDGYNSRVFHPILLANGSLIVNMRKCLFKLDSNSNIKWTILEEFEHSIELDADGNIFVQAKPIDPNFDNKYGSMTVDEIVKISQEGKIIWRKSVPALLIENNLKVLLLGAGLKQGDPLHVNEIRPALHTTHFWQKDDLLVSLRNVNTVLIYRPSTNKVIWYKTGPWISQHDPNFISDSQITVYGNDTFIDPDLPQQLVNGHNNLYIYDFATNSVDTPYTAAFKNCKIRTTEEGRAQILKNGDAFIVENNEGRVLRINKTTSIWEFVNKVDEKNISISGWNRYLIKTGDCKFCLTEK